MNEINTTEPLFDEIKKIDSEGNEFWSARELMRLLGYKDWRNFERVIEKAKQSTTKSYQQISDHFVDVTKMIKIAAGTSKETNRIQSDYKLTRYACYLIAQNGDPTKESIALAQTYFAVRTRKDEVAEKFEKGVERIKARERLRTTEKTFSGVVSQHGVDDRGIAEIRSAGDETLFGVPTRDLKAKFKIAANKPLADVLPTISITAKQLATEMTTFKTKDKNLKGIDPIKDEHVHNNKEIRKLLVKNGIYPEKLAPEEDIEKLKKKMVITEEKIQKITESSNTEVIIDIIGVDSEPEVRDLGDMIKENPGKIKLKILYGDRKAPKMAERFISANEKLMRILKKYIVWM